MDVLELKPCPFCGGEAELVIDQSKKNGEQTYVVKCTRCRSSTSVYNVPYLAVKKWNGLIGG